MDARTPFFRIADSPLKSGLSAKVSGGCYGGHLAQARFHRLCHQKMVASQCETLAATNFLLQ